jgi:hypothetical protein
MTNIAQCACGALTAEAEGEPDSVVICHCRACQRRSGSAFGASVYFPAGQVRISGERRSFTRRADSGGNFTHHFCPHCGTALVWEVSNKPGSLGVALGAFADPAFAIPARSVFEESKHPWVGFEIDIPHYPRGRKS